MVGSLAMTLPAGSSVGCSNLHSPPANPSAHAPGDAASSGGIDVHENAVVTMGGDTGRMLHMRPQAAVCIIRAERHSTGVLITLLVNPDVEAVSGERSIRVGDIDGAVDTVRQFLVKFATSDGQ